MTDHAELLKKARELPTTPGVYLMKDEKGILLYVGKAVSLKNRVSSYFHKSDPHSPKIALMLERVKDFETIDCESEVEALLREARLIKDLKPPYNTDLMDDRTFPYIEVTNDPYPIVRFTRENHVKGHRYFGPFTAVSDVKSCLNLLQKVFHFRICEMPIEPMAAANRQFSPCLLHHIGRCTAPCNNRISTEAYAQDIRSFINMLTGKTSDVRRDLKTHMDACSQAMEYERAALYRDRIKSLDALSQAGSLGSQPELEIAPVNPEEGMQQLQEVLKLDFCPRSIEGFDIAHLQGGQTVASMVSFIDGKPFKAGYRHFKIKTPTGGDDFAAMKEVLQRRYTRLCEEGQPFPHIVLIDGGKGQLGQAVSVFDAIDRDTPCLLSLAKIEEKIYVPGRHNAIRLSRHDTGLRVLQHVRDEAHRFAQRYHHLLRDREVIGE